MSTDATLLSLIANKLGLDVDQLSPDARFDELGRTSFQELEIFTEIENHFGSRLDFAEFSLLATVGDLVNAVTQVPPENAHVAVSGAGEPA